MVSQKSAQVVIGGKVLTITGYEEEDYLHRVAAYINGKIDELNQMSELRLQPADTRAVLIEVNIADDYFKAKTKVEQLQADVEARDREIYELKHELIATKLKTEGLQESVDKLTTENKELLLQKTKLEASLEDALLGSLS